MVYRLVTLDSAREEVEEIVRHLSQDIDGDNRESGFLDELLKKLELIARFPLARPLSHIPHLAARGYRSIAVFSYIVLYRVQDDAVVVSHVVHQRQDYGRLIRRG